MSSDKLRIGLSPCPNDTFICDALLHGKIDTEGLVFEPVFADVESLNQLAFKKELDVQKASFHAFLFLAENYLLLDSGCALGRNCGPLLISKKPWTLTQIAGLRIAIPGKYTTAHLLFSLAFPESRNKKEMIFSEIENAVLSGSFDAGIIIHENRFTYMDKGLIALVDLGSYWEGLTGLPIPLGGFIARRNTPPELLNKINRIMRRSLDFALGNPESSMAFIRLHAQEMRDDVIKAHIGLYVNSFTQHLDEEAREAIFTLFSEAHHAGLSVYQGKNLFLGQPEA